MKSKAKSASYSEEGSRVKRWPSTVGGVGLMLYVRPRRAEKVEGDSASERTVRKWRWGVSHRGLFSRFITHRSWHRDGEFTLQIFIGSWRFAKGDPFDPSRIVICTTVGVVA